MSLPSSMFHWPSAACAACVLLGSAGCLSQSYEISAPELERIADLPVEERGERLRVTQQTSFGDELGDVDWDWDATDWALFVATEHTSHPHRHGQHHRHSGSVEASSDGDGTDAATEVLATAVVVAAAAATAAVTIGMTEGARFDGWVQAPADHPIVLIDDSGRRRWTRLEALTAGNLRGVDHAVLPDVTDSLQRLDRHRLDRQGFVYQLEFGAEQSPFDVPSVAVSGRGGLGYMPTQRFGILFGAAFSAVEGPARSGDSMTALNVDHRVFLQLEAWPLEARRLHLGPYAELGYAWTHVDTPLAAHAAEGPMLAFGAALQLDWTTRLALTLRAGAAWLPTVEAGPALAANDGYRLSPALTLGVSIY